METSLEHIERAIDAENPQIAVIDSIQTMYREGDILCSRKRQPGKGVHRNPDADSKEPGESPFCGGA